MKFWTLTFSAIDFGRGDWLGLYFIRGYLIATDEYKAFPFGFHLLGSPWNENGIALSLVSVSQVGKWAGIMQSRLIYAAVIYP